MNHVSIPAGFRFSGVASGIKKSGKADLALIVADAPATCAGVFTQNKVIAAPLIVSKPRIATGRCQAVLVNSGNANACTGEQGLGAAQKTAALVAAELAIDDALVAVASTGVIGVQLPLSPFETHVGELVAGLRSDSPDTVAKAIMTTDAFAKMSSAQEAGGDGYRLLGIAKGAGMIHPNMATMLGFVVTDANIGQELLQGLLSQAVNRSFNAITVDGDTSTNDMVLVLASGACGGQEILPGSPEADVFSRHLERVLLDLAKMIVRDGEGASKLVRVRVAGAGSEQDARIAARSVSTSSLVKTAFFGEDANWGRIIAAVGYSGIEVDPDKIAIDFNDVAVTRNGLSTGPELEAKATEVLKLDEFTVTIDLGNGDAEFSYYTSDLTYDYVKINADYRS